MNVVRKRGLAVLIEAAKLDKDTRKELDDCYRTARAASWRNLIDVQAVDPSADQVGRVLIFNIRHNRYRLITRVDFGKQKLYIKAVLTHKEYDRKEWQKWA